MRADLALIGYGNVAKRFEQMLDEQRDWLERHFNLTCRVAATASRRHGSRAGEGPCAGAFEAIAHVGRSDADLRIVFETTTLDVKSGEPATAHIRAAIDAGCHVVTANKGPVAFAFHELSTRAQAAGVSFLFEGSVMDGIPIFNLVRETLPAVRVSGFEGVINTTTNHILTAMEAGTDFNTALAQMQADGIAEADASLDVDGWDAAAKVAALANVLMDARITPHDVQRTGIGEASGERARAAAASGRRLKLVASARQTTSGISAVVEPRELAADHLLAGLDGGANALILETDLLDRIAICQLAGSLTQTAYALFTDMITILRRSQ
jgi:homoserine dehydrogenase